MVRTKHGGCHGACLPITPLRLGLAILAVGVALPAGAAPAAAQDLSGRVVEAETGRPIAEALVELGSARRVTLVDRGGRFAFDRLDRGMDSLRVSRFGYRDVLVEVSIPSDEELVIEMVPDPIQLEGVGAEVPSFEESYEALEQLLDMRIGQWPGRTRVADMADLRAWDEEWEGDPFAFLHNGPLGVYAHGGMGLGTWFEGYGPATAEVWIDDRRWWLRAFLETPNETFCRVETYLPSVPRIFARIRVEPPVQIRAYSCSFMGRVAAGLEDICSSIQWGTLVSGPDGDGSGTSIRAAEGRALPRGPGPAPIDLGPGLDLSPNTIGVGSGACRGGADREGSNR